LGDFLRREKTVRCIRRRADIALSVTIPTNTVMVTIQGSDQRLPREREHGPDRQELGRTAKIVEGAHVTVHRGVTPFRRA
jgi:hypothetical protein